MILCIGFWEAILTRTKCLKLENFAEAELLLVHIFVVFLIHGLVKNGWNESAHKLMKGSIVFSRASFAVFQQNVNISNYP